MRKAVYENPVAATIFANAALDKYVAVVTNSTGRSAPAGAGVMPDHITMEDATFQGEAIRGAVPDGNVILIEAGGEVSIGDNVMSNASGKAVEATAGNAIMGKALTAGASGEIVAIQFNYRGQVPTP